MQNNGAAWPKDECDRSYQINNEKKNDLTRDGTAGDECKCIGVESWVILGGM